MLKKEGYTRRMERELGAWRTRFEARRAEAAASRTAPLSAETREKLEASKVFGDAAFAKLAEIKSIAGRYAELRSELDELWKSIDDSPPTPITAAAPNASKRANSA